MATAKPASASASAMARPSRCAPPVTSVVRGIAAGMASRQLLAACGSGAVAIARVTRIAAEGDSLHSVRQAASSEQAISGRSHREIARAALLLAGLIAGALAL